MLEHGLTTEDIEASAKAKRDSKSTKGAASTGKAKVVATVKEPKSPKYQHPKTGATWTGNGRAPAWIANVKDRSKFLIADVADAVLVASASPVSKAKAVAKKASKAVNGADAHRGQLTGPQPAKYRDSQSGATWSGKGPAPAWLAAVKDRSSYLIDSASTGTAEAATGRKAGKSQSSGSGAISRKAAAKKTGAKKAISAKAATVVAEAEPTI
jgi:DNA-binding protein H-NS